MLVKTDSWTSACEELCNCSQSAHGTLPGAFAYPLTWLRTIGLRLKNVIVAVIVLTFLIPKHIEGLQDTEMHQNEA